MLDGCTYAQTTEYQGLKEHLKKKLILIQNIGNYLF